MGLCKVAASPRQRCGPWSSSPTSVRLCPFYHWGSEPGQSSCSLKDWEPPACQTRELQHPKLSVEGKGLGTVCKALRALPSGLCPDTAISTKASQVWGHRTDTRV